jgi:protein gp37
MSTTTTIGWTEKTWNPVVGCTRVSAGCDHCYAVRQTFRLDMMGQENYRDLTVLNGKGDRHFNGTVRCLPERLPDPLHWRKPCRIFVNSMSDLFHEQVPFEFIDKMFAVMALCPQHTFQILTKRPERMMEYLADDDRGALVRMELEEFQGLPEAVARLGDLVFDFDEPLTDSSYCCARVPTDNVWLVVSCEDQPTFQERVTTLLRCPAAVRGVSLEPLLGPINLERIEFGTSEFDPNPDGPMAGVKHITFTMHGLRGAPKTGIPGLSWVIVGGESGPNYRECDPAWIGSIVEQCKAAGVPCFVKQDCGPRPEKQGRLGDDVWAVKEYPR